MRKLILPVVVLLGLIMLLIFPMEQSLHNNECDQVIKTLENKNKVLEKENLQRDEKIKSLKHKADSLMQKVQQERQAVVRLKKKRNEQIQSLDNYTHDELVSFFANLKADSLSVRQ